MSEEQRAAAIWQAPFILMVLDDSKQQQLEYSNAAASELFGREYLDLFGTAGHELVAAGETAQVRNGGMGLRTHACACSCIRVQCLVCCVCVLGCMSVCVSVWLHAHLC